VPDQDATEAERSDASGGATAAAVQWAPETGDLVIDAALRDLAASDPGDLDGQIEAGERVQRTLQSRLTDLGG